MALRRFRTIVITVLLLTGTLGAMTLDEAEQALAGTKKSEIFRAYDTFKASYMQAMLQDDAAVKQRTLQGIVKSGELLHIDISQYKKKLRNVTPLKTVPVTSPKPVPETDTSVETIPVPESKVDIPTVRGQNRLKDVRWEQGNLVFRFEKELGKRDVNFFKLKKTRKKGYRYVFDIHAALDKSRTLTHRDLTRISLAQYKPQTLRLVLESKTALPVRFSYKGNELEIRAGIADVTSPKSVPTAAIVGIGKKEKIVVIDPGHGGKDGGAVGYKHYREKDVVLGIASQMASMLRKRGYTVYMTRSKDHFIKLRKRTHYANRKNADLFVSIHANAVPRRNADKAYGIETYFLSPSRTKRATNAAAQENKAEVEEMDYYGKNTFLNALNSEKIVASHKLAIDLQSSVLSSLRGRYKEVKDGGVREGPFWVLVGAQMPAVLVETGFITHPKEAKRLHSKAYQSYFAKGLADGVERYFAKNP